MTAYSPCALIELKNTKSRNVGGIGINGWPRCDGKESEDESERIEVIERACGMRLYSSLGSKQVDNQHGTGTTQGIHGVLWIVVCVQKGSMGGCIGQWDQSMRCEKCASVQVCKCEKHGRLRQSAVAWQWLQSVGFPSVFVKWSPLSFLPLLLLSAPHSFISLIRLLLLLYYTLYSASTSTSTPPSTNTF